MGARGGGPRALATSFAIAGCGARALAAAVAVAWTTGTSALAAPVIAVDDAGDTDDASDGKVTLREAIRIANGTRAVGGSEAALVTGGAPGAGVAETITFVAPGFTAGTTAVTLGAPLPPLTDPGTNLAAAAKVRLVAPVGTACGLMVAGSGVAVSGLEITGAAVGVCVDGTGPTAVAGTVLTGLYAWGNGLGVRVFGSKVSGAVLETSTIGPRDGTAVAGNATGGVRVEDGAALTLIRNTLVRANAGPGIVVRGGAASPKTDGTRIQSCEIREHASAAGVLVDGGATNTTVASSSLGVRVGEVPHVTDLGNAWGVDWRGATAGSVNACTIGHSRNAGIRITDGTSAVDLSDNTLVGGGDGIAFVSVVSPPGDGNTTSGNAIGFEMDGATEVAAGPGGAGLRVTATGPGGLIVGTGDEIAHTTGVGIDVASASGVVLSGLLVRDGATHGVRLIGANAPILDGCTVIGNTGDGVRIETGTVGAVLTANHIGQDATGAAAGNGGSGVRIVGGTMAQVGGTGLGNVIRGNGGDGVSVEGGSGAVVGPDDLVLDNAGRGVRVVAPAAAVRIIGNGVGVDAALAAHGNGGDGIRVDGASGVVVAGNVVRNHTGPGIHLTAGAVGTLVGRSGSYGGNQVSTNGTGVLIDGAAIASTIGPDNALTANGSDGVRVDGVATLGHRITLSSIWGHPAGKAIALVAGGNAGMPPPVITAASSDGVMGTAAGAVGVEIFADDADEARSFVGTAPVVGGVWNYAGPVPSAGHLTAMATDGAGNTSELSPWVAAPPAAEPGPEPAVDAVVEAPGDAPGAESGVEIGGPEGVDASAPADGATELATEPAAAEPVDVATDGVLEPGGEAVADAAPSDGGDDHATAPDGGATADSHGEEPSAPAPTGCACRTREAPVRGLGSSGLLSVLVVVVRLRSGRRPRGTARAR